jgi:hypothetical protein
MPQIALADILDFGLSYVLAFVLITCAVWYFFRLRPREERRRQGAMREMIGQTAACVRALEGIGVCIEKNARAMEEMRLALDSVARQEACILDLQHRLYAELAKRAGPGAN